MWQAHRKGLLGDQDLCSANVQALVAVISTKGGAQCWEMEQTVLLHEFVVAIAAEMRTGDAAKPITQLWRFLQPGPSDSGTGRDENDSGSRKKARAAVARAFVVSCCPGRARTTNPLVNSDQLWPLVSRHLPQRPSKLSSHALYITSALAAT